MRASSASTSMIPFRSIVVVLQRALLHLGQVLRALSRVDWPGVEETRERRPETVEDCVRLVGVGAREHQRVREQDGRLDHPPPERFDRRLRQPELRDVIGPRLDPRFAGCRGVARDQHMRWLKPPRISA
jgi:hypothetical protein